MLNDDMFWICSVDGCERRRTHGTACSMHRNRMARHGSTEKPVYKAKGSVNLSKEDIQRIKKLHVGFVTKTKIGREFNISPQTVTRVIKGDFD